MPVNAIPNNNDSKASSADSPQKDGAVIVGNYKKPSRLKKYFAVFREKLKNSALLRYSVFASVILVIIASVLVAVWAVKDHNNKKEKVYVYEYKQPTPEEEAREKASSLAILNDEYNTQSGDLKAKINTQKGADKTESLLKLSMLALDAEKIDEAMNYSLQADATTPTHLTAACIAIIYEKKGDIKKAIEYYKLAMTRTPATKDTTGSTPYNDYLLEVKSLEKRL